jgi:hypothetical protein
MDESGAAGGDEDFFVLVEALGVFRAEQLSGHPSDRSLAKAAGVSPTTVGDWLRGRRFPQKIDWVLAVVEKIRVTAAGHGITDLGGRPAGLLDVGRWRAAHQAEAQRRAGVVSAGVQRAQAALVLSGPPAGRPLAEVTDPFALEVHRPAQPEDPQSGLPVLPPYVPREHDEVLGQVVHAAADGRSAIAVLVGGSSMGRTRACRSHHRCPR